MKPDTNKEMELFNGDSYKNYQQNSASIHCHSMKQKTRGPRATIRSPE